MISTLILYRGKTFIFPIEGRYYEIGEVVFITSMGPWCATPDKKPSAADNLKISDYPFNKTIETLPTKNWLVLRIVIFNFQVVTLLT